MVLGVVMMTAMLPTMVGMNEASKSTRDREENRREHARTQRSHLTATCGLFAGTQDQRRQVHNAQVYLGKDGKVYITKHPSSGLTLFNGGFFKHPDFPPDNTSGFVTVSCENPPVLRWFYVDANTHEVRWGGRQESQGNLCGPFDWTKDEAQVLLEGWEGWLAVRVPGDETRIQRDLGVDDAQGIWRLYFDQNDDGADLPVDAEALEICLKRTTAES
ncbi:hypothetical protein N7532_003543 [Penicillium argentinense]|uniref:Uncharacterized protein n=1 Tax=Penicillium argentinense TaxID=1131581 RepID=A0A9W9FML4_9EURO|nr:uncharacterized protein N7532_003543 [Penicillium argentinense]KAJ5103014.1 hypothetical protein N7532_003543 [Penicillium argentinense]